MTALIFQPAKNAMQSGRARTKNWVLKFEPSRRRNLDPLMGWTGTADMSGEVKLTFKTCAEAERFAKAHELEYEILATAPRKRLSKSYSDNFSASRRQSWTH
jgi:NADH dehydrogenase ubiquinone Fe-S protein 4